MADRKRVTTKQFKEIVENNGETNNLIVCKSGSFQVEKELTDDSLTRTFIASTGTVDREGDRLFADGWELDNYRKGGSVLYGHDSRSTPAHVVGRPLATWVEGGKLKNRIQFTSEEINPTGYMVYQMIDKGFLRSSSVGFLPKDFKIAEDEDRAGFMPTDFTKMELLEHSIVPVPANPEALVEAKSAGIDLEPLNLWLQEALDADGSVIAVNRDLLEGAWKAINPKIVSTTASQPLEVEYTEPDPPEPKQEQKNKTEHTETVALEEETGGKAQTLELSEVKAIVLRELISRFEEKARKLSGLID